MITILPTGGEGLKDKRGTHFGTTGSSGPFAASIASFHLAVHRHHLQPGSRPIDRRLFPREALKSRNSFVRTPIPPKSQQTPLISQEPLSEAVGAAEIGGDGMEEEIRTGNSMVTAVFRPYATVSVAVEAGHGFLGEEGEGFLEDCFWRNSAMGPLLASSD